ncbi:MAG: N-acetyl-gamma-glutamyl-phosphate reductase [Candidatus Omnitrophica bacterium]|nr:N-acetyl-gamma-glutamyl-phosphate reductase [Candidatus Omnitrophota bacterium]
MVRVAVVGATGYTGEELIECLLRNSNVEITSLSALIDKPTKFSSLHPRFAGRTDITCKELNVDEVAEKADVVFLALPHTLSMKFAPQLLAKGKRVIDLSADYRLPADVYEKWYTGHLDKGNIEKAVYGLPELNRKKIKGAAFISNPGCYPTSVILALLPLIKLITAEGVEPIIDSKSGATGAGRKAALSLCFGEVDQNLRCYKANEHQHMPEMEHVLSNAAGKAVKLHFTPHLLPIRRGIMSTIYLKGESFKDAGKLHGLMTEYYRNEPFVRIRPFGTFPEILEVAGTNYCDIGIKHAGGITIIVSVIDNLLKGASGQATQNLNIMCGFDERTGLI